MSDENDPLIGIKKHKKKLTILGVVILVIIPILAVIGTVSFVLSVHAAASRSIAAVYERIGNKECPDIQGTTTLVYEGFTAGFSTTAGSTLFKCLPLQEEHISYYDDDSDSKFTNQSEIRYVNATEYRTFVGGDSNNHHDAYCAVCQANGRGTIQVLPATHECAENSWIKEYEGYLMTDDMATTFVCVDKSLQGIKNTEPQKPNAPVLRHIVVPSKLGDNIKNEYIPSSVLSCVVCSK